MYEHTIIVPEKNVFQKQTSQYLTEAEYIQRNMDMVYCYKCGYFMSQERYANHKCKS